MKLFLLVGVLFLAACGGSSDKKTTEQADSAKAPELVLKWESDSSLKVPESVLFDKAAQVLYVSNIDGTNPWEADGKGSIGKVGLDGKVIGMTTFGESAPGPVLMKEFGFTVENVVSTATALCGK